VWQTVLPYYLVEAITLSKMSHQSINLFPIHVRFNEPERERERETEKGEWGGKRTLKEIIQWFFFPRAFVCYFPRNTGEHKINVPFTFDLFFEWLLHSGRKLLQFK
jgi:hypothetical protein